jgi:hypothetical protein
MKNVKPEDWKLFKVLCRFETLGVQTDYHLLVMDDTYVASISGPDLLTTVHWRLGDIGRAVMKMESEITKLVDFKVVETTFEEAIQDHLIVCKKCQRGEACFAGDQLQKRVA